MDSIAALDAYLEFLDTSNTSEKEPFATPHIDSVLQNYQEKSLGQAGCLDSLPGSAPKQDYVSRLKELEEQLTELLHRSKTHHSPSKAPASANSSTSGQDTVTQHESEGRRTRRRRDGVQATSIPTRQAGGTSTTVSHRRNQRTSSVHARDPQAKPIHHSLGITSPTEDRQTKDKLMMQSQGPPPPPPPPGPSLQALSQELHLEHQRRCKAEVAVKRLVDHTHQLRGEVEKERRKQELMVAKVAQLGGELATEREAHQLVKKEIENLHTALKTCEDTAEQLNARETEQKKAYDTLVEAHRILREQSSLERHQMVEQVQEVEGRCAGAQREAEHLRTSAKQLRHQLHQVQELLVTRERDHQREMDRCRPVDGCALHDTVAREVEKERCRMESAVEQQKQWLEEQKKAYHSLEEEFRMALRIETSRYQELYKDYSSLKSEVDSCRETSVAALQREQRATSLVSELTAMVKEQKGRLLELTRSKQEMMDQLQERVGVLEAEVAIKHKLEVKLQSLQEENSKLLAQVTAQESVVEGLREERKLWSKELAHQGKLLWAALAQDRGKLEAQVESLSNEVKSLREQSQSDHDALRVKGKIVEDLSQTVQQLKQSLQSKEQESAALQLDWQKVEEALHSQLEDEQTSNQDLRDQVTDLVERKEELKKELDATQNELEEWKKRYSKLKAQWDEKTKLLASLEQDMARLQQSFSQGTEALTRDRDAALEAIRNATVKAKMAEEACRAQLDAKDQAYDQLALSLESKNKELELANQRVLAVENEMRVLLTEVESEKKGMEQKFQKLSKAFKELHDQLT
ncbi:hypothetical protein EMCRGX_G031648 [Ephydatia muelleri]